jgi:hypothetical protein
LQLEGISPENCTFYLLANKKLSVELITLADAILISSDSFLISSLSIEASILGCPLNGSRVFGATFSEVSILPQELLCRQVF